MTGGLDGKVFDLAHADAGRTDALHQQRKTGIAGALRGGEQTVILRARQLALGSAKNAALDLEEPRAAILPAEEAEQAVQRGKRGVDGGWGLPPLGQMCLPFGHGFFCDCRAVQPYGKGADAAQIFLPRCHGVLVLLQLAVVSLDHGHCDFPLVHNLPPANDLCLFYLAGDRLCGFTSHGGIYFYRPNSSILVIVRA